MMFWTFSSKHHRLAGSRQHKEPVDRHLVAVMTFPHSAHCLGDLLSSNLKTIRSSLVVYNPREWVFDLRIERSGVCYAENLKSRPFCTSGACCKPQSKG